MARLSRLPVIPLLFFLGVHAPTSHGTPLPPTYDGAMCSSESFWCGAVEIHYPFYLSNATKETPDHNTYYSCGYTDPNISCQRGNDQAWSPIILLGGDNYTVLNIFYNTSTIILADTDVLAAAGRCPALRHNVSFGRDWLRLHDDASSQHNLTFFSGCYDPRDEPVPPGLSAHRINCSGFGESPAGTGRTGGVAFVFASSRETVVDASREYELAAAHCGEVVTVPVRGESLAPGRSDPAALAGGGYGAVLREGFELEWSRRTTDLCYLCERRDSGGHCAYGGRSREFLGCLCYDGKVAYPSCRGNGAITTSPSSKSIRNHK